MTEGLTDAQILERLLRLERNMRLVAERTGASFADAQRAVNSL